MAFVMKSTSFFSLLSGWFVEWTIMDTLAIYWQFYGTYSCCGQFVSFLHVFLGRRIKRGFQWSATKSTEKSSQQKNRWIQERDCQRNSGKVHFIICSLCFLSVLSDPLSILYEVIDRLVKQNNAIIMLMGRVHLAILAVRLNITCNSWALVVNAVVNLPLIVYYI